MGKGKKFLSLFLAAAMAVTGINVGVPTTVQAAETEIAGMPERLAYFSFDQGTMNENGTIVSADDGMVSDDNGASTSVTASVVRGDASISDEAESKVGTGALKLSNNAYLKVTGLGLENKTAVTVSCWARLSAAANNQWIFSASQPVSGAGTRADEQYVGMMYGAGGKSVLAYRSKDAVIDSSNAASTQDGEPASRAEGTEEFDGTAWHYVTFVMGAQDGKLYLDGKLAGEISEQNSLATILGQNGELYIGANPALNQFFNGFVDEFTVYADAMTEAQVQEKYESYLDEETTKPAVVKYVVEIDGEEKALQAEADTTLTFDEVKNGYFYTLTDEDKRIVSTVADAEGVEEKVYRPISLADVKAEPGATANDPYVVTVNYQLSTKPVSVACAEQPVHMDNIDNVTILDQKFFESSQEIEEAPELDENNESVYHLYDISKAPKQIKYEGENGKVLYVLAPISEQLYLAPDEELIVTVLYKEADKTKEATVKYVAEIDGELTELQADKTNGTISLNDQLEYTYTLTEDEERVLSTAADPNGQIQKVYRPVENSAKVEAQADGSYVVTITYALSVNSECSLWPVGEGGTIEDLIETEDFTGIDVECEEAVDLKDGEPVYVYYVQSSDMPVEITDTNGEVYIRQVEENTPIAADEAGFIYVPYKKKSDTKEFTLKYTCGTNTVTETAYFDVDGDNYVYTIPEDKKLVPVEADPKVYVPDVTDRVLTVSKADAETTTELSVPCKLSTQKATVNYVSGTTVVKDPKAEVDVQEYKEADGSYAFKYALVTSGADREDKLVGEDGKVYVVAENANMNAVLENGKYVVNIEYKLSQQKATVKFVSNGKSLKADKEVSLVETAEGKFIYTLAEGEEKIEAEGKFYVPVADQSLEAVKTGDDYVVTVNYELSKKKVDIAYQCGETVVKTEKDVEFTETAKDQYTYSLEAGKIDGTDGVRYSYEAAELTAGKDDTKVTVACTKSVKKVTIEFTVPEDRFTFTKEYEFNETTDDSITYTLPEKIEHEGKMYLPQETELTLGMDDDEYWVDCERSTKDVTVKFFRMEGETETEITSETYKFQETVEGTYTYTLSDTTKVTDEESGKVYVPKSFDELSVAADAESFEVKVECVNSKVTVTVHYMYGEGEDAVELDTELKEFEETTSNEYTYAYAELPTIEGQEEGVAYVPKPENEQTKLTAERSEDGKKWEITAFYNQVVSKDVEVTFVSGEGENEVEVAKETVKFVKGEDGTFSYKLDADTKFIWNGKVYRPDNLNLTVTEETKITVSCTKSTKQITVDFVYGEGETDKITKEVTFEETEDGKFTASLSKVSNEAGEVYTPTETEKTVEADVTTTTVTCERSKVLAQVKYMSGDVKLGEGSEEFPETTANVYTYDLTKAPEELTDEAGVVYIPSAEGQDLTAKYDAENHQYVVTVLYEEKGVGKKFTVKFQCGDVVVKDAIEVSLVKGEDGKYTYEPAAADAVVTIDGNTYVRIENPDAWSVGEDVTEILVSYKENDVKEVVGTYEATTRVNVAPELPETVKVKMDDNTEAQAGVTWTIAPEDYAELGEKTIHGTITGKDIEATLTLKVVTVEGLLMADYSFDEDELSDGVHPDNAERNGEKVATVNSVDGLKGKAVQLPGGTNGAGGSVHLPDDLLQIDGQTQDDFTISMFMKRESIGNSFALTLHAAAMNQSNPYPYIGFINNNNGRIRVEYENTGHATNGDTKTPTDKWMHIAIVTKGSTGDAWLYVDGEIVGEIHDLPDSAKASAMQAQNNWLGRAPWPDDDYKGTFDQFQVYNAVLTAGEIQEICNNGYSEQVAKAEKNLAITSAVEGVEYDKDNVTANLNLPTQNMAEGITIEWSSSDNTVINPATGEVVRPAAGQEDKTVTLTATVKAGYDFEKNILTETVTVKAEERATVDKDLLTQTIGQVQEELNKATLQNIYTEESLKKVDDVIEAALDVLTDENATQEQVDKAVEDLNQAAQEPLVLKTLDQLNETALSGHYPLTEDASDKSGKGAHGTAKQSVTFDKNDGATFNGGKALENCITLPADKLTITDQITFSFWARDAYGDKSNAFGVGSGNGFGNGGTDAHFFYVNTHDGNNLIASMNPKYWDTPAQIVTDAAEKDVWHHIVTVLDGTSLTLYIDGAEVETKDVGHALTEMWNADEDNRHAIIGNCSYAMNPYGGDADYKGSIKDFRIYNASLAESQVAAINKYMQDLMIANAKAELQEKITEANTKAQDTDYPETERNKLKDAAEQAQEVVNDNAATQEQVEDALKNLIQAITDFENSKPAPPELNKAALESKIADALDKVKDTSYPEAARNELNTAISTAQNVLANATTQKEIDDAVTALNTAISKFENSKPNKSALTDKIADATEKVQDESYPEAARNELNAAIEAAQEVANNVNATQAEVDQAAQDLADAITKFENSKPDKSALSDKITDATEKVNDTSIAYPEEARETLRAAIEAAQGVVNNVNATQAEVNKAAQDLAAAILAFECTAPDKSELVSAIASAEKLDESKYTSDSWKLFQEALTKAKEINAKTDATQKEIDDAYSALTKAQKALVKVVLVKSLSITNSRTLKVFAGKQVKMKLQVNPTNATNKKVTWSISSSQQKYATVDSKGIVTTKKAGAGKTVTVTGKATDGSGKKIVVKLTLMKDAVKKISFDAASKSVKAGNKITLKPTIKTNGKDVNKKLYWKVSNTKYATIDQKGVVTAKKAGKGKTVTVTARTTDGTQKVATIKIKIK